MATAHAVKEGAMPTARKRNVQPEDFYLLKNVSDPQISPDGKKVAYCLSWPDKEANETRVAIYVAPSDGKSPARRFTQGNKDHSPRWSPDGRYLAFVSDRGEKSQLYLAPLDGGEALRLTKEPSGVSQPAWSPDGRRIAFISRTGPYKEAKERNVHEKAEPKVIRDLRYKLDGVGFFDKRRAHIFVADIESGESTQITKGDWNDDQPSWSPNGRQIAFISDREKDRFQRQWRSDVYVVGATGGQPRKLTRSLGACAQPTFSPDGRNVAFVGHEHGEAGLSKNMHLLIVPSSGGRVPVSVSASLDRLVAGWPMFMFGRTFQWVGKGSAVLFLAGDRGAQHLFRVGVGNGSVSKVLAGERQIEAFSLAADGKKLAFTAIWSTQPGEVYITSINGRQAKETMLSRANDDLRKAVNIGPLRRMGYKGIDGLEMEAFVLYPPGYKAGQQYPLAVNVHGGPHSAHPGSRAWVEFQSLAGKGYVVLLPNPRGSTTYGEAFSEACVRDWGGKDYEDIMLGVDELVDRGIADPDRLYLGGYSYGGFMTSWAVGHTNRFRAAMVGAPVSNQTSMFGTGDIPLFDMHEIGGTPQDNPREYSLRSPISYMGNVDTPVLLLHHEGDLRCPIGQSEEIFHALRALGKEVEFVRYPGGFHTYNTHAPSQVVDRTKRTIRWYETHAPRKVRQTAKRTAAVKA
jgi:dipeptidyl aminopeptidase/acylaminoacyl peptidase